jgi:hypothetical protein
MLMGVLLVHCVASATIGPLHCSQKPIEAPFLVFLYITPLCCWLLVAIFVTCAMVRYYPFPLPCAGGGTFI